MTKSEVLKKVELYSKHEYKGFTEEYQQLKENCFSAINKFADANGLKKQFIAIGNKKEISFTIDGIKYY